MMKFNVASLKILGFAFATALVLTASQQVISPNGRARVILETVDGQLQYAVKWSGTLVIRPSAIAVVAAPVSALTVESDRIIDATWRTVWGERSEIRDHCREVQLQVKMAPGMSATLICRAYNDGVAFRFICPQASHQPNFRCEHRLDPSVRLWWTRGEQEPGGPVQIAEAMRQRGVVSTPVVMEFAPGRFGAILESDLYSAPKFGSMRIRWADRSPATLVSESVANSSAGPILTPWRVILLGDQPAELLMSTVVLNLAAPCKLADTSWIKPGKAVWDWRVHGYRASDGFVYGVNTASYRRLIDFAARNRIQYLLIDDNWFTHIGRQGVPTIAEGLDIAEVMRFADTKGVGVLLYYDRRKGDCEDSVLLAAFARRGAVGLKYGFMGDSAEFTRSTIDAAAANRLLIDFHDQPCPMSGVERTMPNLIAREYCHAQMDGRRAFTPESFLKMAAINALVGPLDQDNGNYGLHNINRGQRERGPLLLNSYHSTVVAENARVLVIPTGLICLPDAPEEYEKKADLFEFIRQMPPATWDETRVLNCRIGECITTARRSGREWFVGSVINAQGGELTIPLSFLGEDTTYQATFYEDALPSGSSSDPEAYRVRRESVHRGDILKARLAPNGGHCIWIRPAASDSQLVIAK